MSILHVRLTAELREKLDKMARRDRRTLAETVRIVIEEYFKEGSKR